MSCGSYLLPGSQIILSDRYGAALFTLFLSHFPLCCCYFAAALRCPVMRTTFHLFLWLPVAMKENFSPLCPQDQSLVIKGTRLTISPGPHSGRVVRAVPLQNKMWHSFLAACLQIAAALWGQRCHSCSHKVTLMSRNREKHMCPDLKLQFIY